MTHRVADRIALDSSVALPLLMRTHPLHGPLRAWLADRPAVLGGHASAETYSVATRVPAGLRVSPGEVAAAVAAWFGTPIRMGRRSWERLPRLLAEADVSGGAVYDALVGLAARDNGLVLATRDARAKRTYDALDVDVEVVVV